ncbi:MAG: tRNA lysidine(34) synthetase TilS, partial [Oscillospiraceae bacterium]|nr:tRNA lysidine(34) synthetase TilS [Oscillospiraceae bacterium]
TTRHRQSSMRIMPLRTKPYADTIYDTDRQSHFVIAGLFIEKRIPKAQREKIPVIADGKNTVAVYGIGTDERYIPQNGDEIYAIEINKGCWENEK